MAVGFGLSGFGSIAAVAQTDDPALTRELALRALGEGSGVTVTLSPGRLTPTDPAIVTPTGWRLVGSLARVPTATTTGGFSPNSAVVFWDTTLSPGDAISALNSALASAGWTVAPQFQQPGGGFVPAQNTAPATAMLCGGKSAYANATATANAGEATKVNLNITTFPPNSAYLGPCTPTGVPQTSRPSLPQPYAQLPRLQLPAGVEVVNFGGGGGGQYSVSSGVTIQKAPPIATLDQSFSTQLQSAGWTRFGGASDPTVSSQLWRKRVDNTDFQALVSVATAIGGEGRLDLSMVVSVPATGGPFPYPLPVPQVTIVPVPLAVGAVPVPVTVVTVARAVPAAAPAIAAPPTIAGGFAPPGPGSTPTTVAKAAKAPKVPKASKAKPAPKAKTVKN